MFAIDGVASVFLLLRDTAIFSCLAPFFVNLPPYAEMEKKPFEYCNFFAFGNSGKQTWAACAATECDIHYTIASRQLIELL